MSSQVHDLSDQGWLLPVSARKTRSSTAIECVKTVAVAAPGTATRAELPLRAGPAGFASLEVVSPGCNEMRVVFGVQEVAPIHVSRTKTCRKPLFEVDVGAAADLAAAEFAEFEDNPLWLGVTARNAMNRPDALTDGKMPSVPTRAPPASVETSCVEGEHCDCAPVQVSRR
jgi:hypothetical protein